MTGKVLYRPHHKSAICKHFDGRQFFIKVGDCGEAIKVYIGDKLITTFPFDFDTMYSDGGLNQYAVDFACDILTGIQVMETLKKQRQEQPDTQSEQTYEVQYT